MNSSALGTRVLFNGVPAPVALRFPDTNQRGGSLRGGGESIRLGPTRCKRNACARNGIPSAATAPAIFAILNQDGTLNSAANPAAAGSIVQIFATGEGQTLPLGVTGGVTGTATKQPVLPVSVSIGGVSASVTSASTAPNAVAGLFQINAQIPAAASSGAIPITIQVGSVTSPAGTVAVK